ncbi:MAG: glutamate 5-kinase, partial [Parafilimonas terrae]|nr:glutamate 5-kinase [Parafilimonas terrae]
RGLVAYDATHAARLLGARSADIARLLGQAGRPVMVHRDDMALVGG